MPTLRPARSFWPGRGYTLIELLFVLGLLATVAGLSIPSIQQALDDLRSRAAARYLSGRLHQARIEALVRNASVALRFAPQGTSYAFTQYVDGNRNGIRRLDIERGLDRATRAEERLRDQFPGIDFGAMPDLPAVEAAGEPAGGDPVRLGAGNMVVFTAQGTATPGSLYLRGRGNRQLVVRIFGETGKTKILAFDARSRSWKPL